MAPDDDRPTSAPPAWTDERPTSVPCLACGGHSATQMREGTPGRFSVVMCRWCTGGGMSPVQVARWSEHEARRKT